MVEPCPLIEISGSPRERGRMYGRQAAQRIRKGIAHYSEQLRAMDLDQGEIGRLVAQFMPRIASFDPAYAEEIEGIAEGAGLDVDGVALLNARTEILQLGRREAEARTASARNPDGCTGVVVMPEAAEAGRLIHAQNWDWKAECAETAVVVRIRQEHGPDILTFTEAGGLARSGLNAAGIAITANYLQCDRDYRDLGVPLALIRRKTLEQEHLALAMHAVYVTPKSAANNMIVSQCGGVAIDFECAPDETFQVHPENGLLVHANHFVSPVALAKLRDTGIASTPDSLYRDIRVRDLLRPQAGRITRETVKTALADDFGSPWSVCRPPRKSLSSTANNLSATVAAVVMEPALGVMEVALLPALNRQFTTYTLDMAVRQKAA